MISILGPFSFTKLVMMSYLPAKNHAFVDLLSYTILTPAQLGVHSFYVEHNDPPSLVTCRQMIMLVSLFVCWFVSYSQFKETYFVEQKSLPHKLRSVFSILGQVAHRVYCHN